MHDPVQNKDLRHILNDIFAACCRGTVSDDGLTWTWNGEILDDTLNVQTQEGQITYGDYLRHQFPVCSDVVVSNTNKRIRRQKRSNFTSPGYPGESLASQFEEVLEQLRLPSLDHDLHDIGLGETTYYFILPSFFQMIQWLHSRQISFNLIFRTYGDDLNRIALEFNAFCEGKHPFFRLKDGLMDGSDGTIDRRIHIEAPTGSPHRHGTFVRTDTTTTLVMGTFLQPSNNSIPDIEAFYQNYMCSSGPSLEFIHGIKSIHEFFASPLLRQQQSTLAIRDFYPHWFHHGEMAEAGKLLTIDEEDSATHAIFLDDNIFIDSPHIVDCRKYPYGTSVPYEHTHDLHLVRVEPFKAIMDKEYFVKRLQNSLSKRMVRQSE